jgi:hypothetical protein
VVFYEPRFAGDGMTFRFNSEIKSPEEVFEKDEKKGECLMKKIHLMSSLVAFMVCNNSMAASSCTGKNPTTGNAYAIQIETSGENLHVSLMQEMAARFEGLLYPFQTSLYVGPDGKKHERTTYWNRSNGQQGAMDLKLQVVDQDLLQVHLASPENVDLKCVKAGPSLAR